MAGRDMEQRRWERLITWLRNRGMQADGLKVERRPRSDGGYGLFTRDACAPKEVLFTIPSTALLNIKTLRPLYPSWAQKLSATQLISLHLCRHRPVADGESSDPAFGPYISTLPRDFSFHPLTWLVEEEGLQYRVLLDHLPTAVSRDLKDLEMRFSSDWVVCQEHLHDVSRTESDYLWAWLNVNTRCMYYRVKLSASDPDNMALCPVMDFANHRPEGPHMQPRPTKEFPARANMSFAAPEAYTDAGEELYFSYGPHCNRKLFVEYGFALRGANGEVDVDDLVERTMRGRADGKLLQELLENEGYWGDWTIHSSPEPNISFRLLAAMRLLSLPTSQPPASPDELSSTARQPLGFEQWQQTLYGSRDCLPADIEEQCRISVMQLAEKIKARASDALAALDQVDWDGPVYVLNTVKVLWEEERDVADAVLSCNLPLW
uniref:SET domain-containing protein n=1 Tax=Schizophyllum commune (strain H4-8 / FGSC 9210) TaxID=578458 RepID=D8PSK7_SCHCM